MKIWHNARSAFECVYLAEIEEEEEKAYKLEARKIFESLRDKYQTTKAKLLEILKKRKQNQNNTARGDVTYPSLFHSSAVYPPGTTFDMSEICIKVPACDTQDFYVMNNGQLLETCLRPYMEIIPDSHLRKNSIICVTKQRVRLVELLIGTRYLIRIFLWHGKHYQCDTKM